MEGPSTTEEQGPADLPQRKLRWFYGAGALGLAPWIIALFVSQTPQAPARDVRALAIGLLIAIIAGTVVTMWTYSIGHPLTAMAASFSATVVLISAWFRTLTHTGTTGWTGSIGTFAILAAVIAVLCALVVRRAIPLITVPHDPSFHQPPDRWLMIALATSSLALAPSLLIVLVAVPPVGIARHLRLAWTGLDVCELIAMASTAVALSRRSPAAVVAATATGALLLCDAWINVVPTTGATRSFGIGLATLELPIATVSFWIAAEISRSATRPDLGVQS